MATYALTGAASGIGAALSQQLAEAGDTVISVDIKGADVTADLSSSNGRQAAIAAISERASEGLDGFIPLAGLGGGTGHPPALITALNYFGAVELVEGLRPLLTKSNGTIVLLCSNSGAMSPHEHPLIQSLLAGDEAAAIEQTESLNDGMEYMAGKRALAYWMRRNALSYARDGVRMNAVAPGPIETPMTAALFENPDMKGAVDALIGMTPIERMGQPAEVVNAIRFLLSPDSSYVCGTVLFVDGGYDAATRSDHF